MTQIPKKVETCEMVKRLGIQSWCFRGYKDHPAVISALKACGVTRLEMCGVHFDPTSGPDCGPVIDLYKEHGITLSAYGVHGFGADRAKARKVFEFAARAGFDTISANLGPGGLETVEALCKEFGKKVAIHNHGRRHHLGSVEALNDLFSRASSNVGLCLDTAWMLDSGWDPVEVARQFRERLYGLHIKDFVFDRAGKPEDVVVGKGNLNLDGLIQWLIASDFQGYLTLEYEGDVENPIPPTAKCVQAVKKSFAKFTTAA
jgi:sugar phosphate isomerase/epimerase